MINIPWYAWLNIIGLVLIWLPYIISHRHNHYQQTVAWIGHFKILTLIFFIFLNWNQGGIPGLSYYLICLTVIVTILVAWDITASLAELLLISINIERHLNTTSSNALLSLGSNTMRPVQLIESKAFNTKLFCDFICIGLISATLIPPVYIAVKLSLAGIP